MSSWEVFTEQVADLARWGARVAADTKAFNEIRRIDANALEPYLEDRLAYEAALIAAPEEVRFVLDKKAAQLHMEDLDAAEKARHISFECTEEADVARWAASLQAKEAKLGAEEAKWNAMARAEEAEELVRRLKKEVEQVHLADRLAREATQRAETAEKKFLRLSAVIDSFLQERDAHLVWAKFQESMGEY